MSKYTVQLRWLIENNFDLGLQDYPIFDESYRETLNNKIKDHFYFREIGFETPELFKNRLNEKMDNIMPYYNQLYESQKIEIEPILPYSMETTYTHTGNATSESSATSENTVESQGNSEDTTQENRSGKNLFSDTPQGQLTQNEITNNDYLTNATITSDNNSTTSNGNTTSKTDSSGSTSGTNNAITNENSTESKKGNIGNKSQSELLIEYRKSFINIDAMVMDELNVLFMGVW